MKRGAYPVPGEVANDAVVKTLRVRLDHSPYHVEAPARGNGLDAPHHRLVRTFDQEPGFRIDGASEKGGVRVAVYAIDIGGDIDVDDVAVADNGRIGDAVADHLVERRAQRLGVSPIAERGRICAMGDEEFVSDLIEFIGGNSWPYRLSDGDQRLRSQLSRTAHPVDGLAILDLGSGEWSGPPAPDILRTGNVRRHRTRRREATRRERGNLRLLDGVHGQEAYVGDNAMAEERSRHERAVVFLPEAHAGGKGRGVPVLRGARTVRHRRGGRSRTADRAGAQRGLGQRPPLARRRRLTAITRRRRRRRRWLRRRVGRVAERRAHSCARRTPRSEAVRRRVR